MPGTLVKPLSYGPSSAADPTADRRFGGAFWMSALMHGLAVALALLLTVALKDRSKPEEKPFELVAGPGDDFNASEAPAGSEAGAAELGEIAFTPTSEVPSWTPPAPVPVEPLPPVPPPPPTPVAPVAPAAPSTAAEPPPVPNFTRQINRTIQREKEKTDREIKKQREAESRAAKERELAAKRLNGGPTSFSDFQKANPDKSSPAQRATAAGAGAGPRLDPKAIKQGVTGGTGPGSKGAGGTALSASLATEMQRYFAMLTLRLREAHAKPGGVSDLLSADVQFTLAANGAISGVRIVRSSGNGDFDQSVLEAFARVRMPARPDGKSDVNTLTFRIKEA
jgi:colicin import membrane protein